MHLIYTDDSRRAAEDVANGCNTEENDMCIYTCVQKLLSVLQEDVANHISVAGNDVL